jgi:hypothetical protein
VFQLKTDFYFRKARWQRFLPLFALLPALAALSSCGSSTAATPTISVTASASTVNVNGTVQFTATIANLSSTLATWQVNSVIGGNLATTGSIDSNGKYTAPPTPPTNNVVVITAVAQAQTSLTATANLTIEPPATITGITPATATVVAGAQQAFVVTFSSGTGNGVSWYINNSPTCSATLGVLNGLVTVNGANTYPYGKITNQGNYTAPLIPPPGGAIALTAVSTADSKQTFCETINLAYGNASLQGPFAFSDSGRVISTNAFFARAGSFTADGSGNLAGGLETYSDNGQTGIVRHKFLGNYNIGPDGRGTMEFCENDTSSSCAPGAAQVFFRVAILSAQQVQIVEFSQPGSLVAQRTASGQMVLQDVTVFKTAGLIGAYSFDFSGVSSNVAAFSTIGEFSTDGRGAISTSLPISQIPGRMDINNNGTLSQPAISNTSSYSINSNGQGTATLLLSGDPHFSQLVFDVYMVSASQAIFVESDGQAVLVGNATKQQATSCSWGPNSLNGFLVAETSGTDASGSVTDLINVKADGIGTATAITNDENNAGVVTSGTTLAGSYTIDNCGRGTLSLSGPKTHSYAFYLISSSAATIQETTAGTVGHGLLVQPQSGSVTLGTLNSFALNLAGVDAAGVLAREDIIGQITTLTVTPVTGPSTTSVSAGSLDINNSGGLGATQTLALSAGSLTAGNRATLTLTSGSTTRNYVLYFVSQTQFFVMDADSSPASVAIGSLYQQF